ncbi:MAG: hypothetical protein EOQ39_34980 [Mesorhizobium sp.]|nr:MAG: hypothetical protein EOQ39_34980 [Mesorhizobium sp.]
MLAKRGPHPNPPQKGEGTLPRAFNSSLAPKRQAIGLGGRQRKSPSPCGEGLGVGVRAGRTSQEFHMR